MGAMICKAHGHVGFVETCSHVAKEIDQGRLPKGRRFTILGTFLICDKCFSSFGFERCISLADLSVDEQTLVNDDRWQAFDSAYEQLRSENGRRAFCVKCLAELELQSSSA